MTRRPCGSPHSMRLRLCQDVGHSRPEELRGERLDEEWRGARIHTQGQHLLAGKAGDEKRLEARMPGAEAPVKLRSGGGTTQVDVRDQDVRPKPVTQGLSFRATGGGLHSVAAASQQEDQQVAHLLIVLDQKYSGPRKRTCRAY